MLDLWADRESFLAALDRLPQTLQHSDAGRKNLFLRRSDAGKAETIAIDWGWIGIGPIGSELAPLVASASLWFMDVQPEDLPEVEQIAFAGYLQGLREAGWRGMPSSRAWAMWHHSPCALPHYLAGSNWRYQLRMGRRGFTLSILNHWRKSQIGSRRYADLR